DGEPALRLHSNGHALGDIAFSAGRVRVAQGLTEIPARHRAQLVGARRRFVHDNRTLDAHVLVRRGLSLGAETEAVLSSYQYGLARAAFGLDRHEPAGLVRVPDRNCERSMCGVRDADDSYVDVGEEGLALV